MCYYPLMTYLILVRHGQNDWVKEHRLAGWIPGIHLNDVGREQAQAAAARESLVEGIASTWLDASEQAALSREFEADLARL